MQNIDNFINNQFVPAKSGASIPVYEPATGQVYAQVADSAGEDINAAVTSAANAFPAWSALDSEQRASHLFRLADVLESRMEEMAAAESMDTGKPLNLAKAVDIPRAVSNIRFFAAATSQFSSESHAMGRHAINYTLRPALGVVACISPWNLPLYLLSWKIAPALACGNTVVAKPSEITPLTASLLGEVCQQAGLPSGVLNIVQGQGMSAGDALVNHPQIRAVSFTGSTATGAVIATSMAGQFKKVALEMGGKNPTLVFADCDLEKTTTEVVRAAYSNQGQLCLCGSRILVEDTIYNDFRTLLLQKVKQLRVGDPLDTATNNGAIVSKVHFEKILSHLELARNEGGNILCGGSAVKVNGRCAQGWFIAPTLIDGLDNQCRTNQEEIFGPVATLQTFSSEEEAIGLANDSGYGLACSIWSQDISRCHRIATRIECGIIWINCWMQRDLRTPFGGMKSSGVGREGGHEAMRFFTGTKNVCVEYGK